MSYCAICASTHGPFVKEPLGRDDAMVNVCPDCATGASVRLGPERGYECREGISSVEMRKRLAAVASPADRRSADFRGSAMLVKDSTPGFVVERLDIRRNGKRRDRNEITRIVHTLPWGKAARYLGCDGSAFIFEHPPKVTLRNDADPIADLKRMGRE